tara:strand:- start:683 stop:928 length:246 start_codon:yes stop_codon:yes gene_type:complete
MNIEQNIREHWPYRSEEIKPKQYRVLRLTMLHVIKRLDYMQQLSYIESVLNEPVTLRHFEETIKKIGLQPCYIHKLKQKTD